MTGALTPIAVNVGRGLSIVAILFLIMDGGIKLVPIQPVIDTAHVLGWPADPALWRSLGSLLLVLTLLYAIPRTSLLGAVLLTGYLGGAMATQLRIGAPLFTHIFFSVYVGAFVWVGLWLRSASLRTLILNGRC